MGWFQDIGGVIDDVLQFGKDVVDEVGKGIGGLAKGAVEVISTTTTELVATPLEVVLGENEVSEELREVNKSINDVTKFVIDKAVVPLGTSIVKVPLNKVGYVNDVVQGGVKFLFTDEEDEGLDRLARGAGGIARIVLTVGVAEVAGGLIEAVLADTSIADTAIAALPDTSIAVATAPDMTTLMPDVPDVDGIDLDTDQVVPAGGDIHSHIVHADPTRFGSIYPHPVMLTASDVFSVPPSEQSRLLQAFITEHPSFSHLSGAINGTAEQLKEAFLEIEKHPLGEALYHVAHAIRFGGVDGNPS